MSQNPNFTSEGRLNATITAILDTKTGVNTSTGEVYEYLIVEAQAAGLARPIKENVFVNKFNPKDSIVVGASIDILTSKNITTGKVNTTVFLGNKYASFAEKLAAAGCSAETVKAGSTQAADAIRARMAARAAARG